jgi:nitrate reductase gamma subunit
MSEFLHFAEHRLQEASLGIMAVVYTTRLLWLFHFRGGRDRQAPTEQWRTNPARGALYSIANVVMPWAMESTRKNPWFYLQFVTFHIGVTLAIALSFVIPYGPGLLEIPGVVPLLQVFIGAACLVGCIRMVRRIRDPYIHAISTPDDFFSLALLIVWFFFGVLAAPNSTAYGEWPLLTFFLLTAFFLIYVPFSKISHYLYYPFTRFWLGKTLGYRGVFPLPRRTAPDLTARKA